MSWDSEVAACLQRRALRAIAGAGAMGVALALASGPASALAAPAGQARPGQVQHWGAFIGGINPFRPVDVKLSPASVALPGRITEIGASNSTQYALLGNGSLYAWGVGTRGQLGDGSRRNSLARPVRVRFPSGVKIASIPVDVMPYDTALAVDTTGHVWGWGLNSFGQLCLGTGPPTLSPSSCPSPV
jgi:hypothetical protein